MSRIAVAMSGGVDSCTAAALLLEAGHEIVGVTLRLWAGGDATQAPGRCCSPADIADARAVAAHLGFPHFVFDHGREFEQEIVQPFVAEYLAGRTPSPCVRCNRLVKFNLLWRLARSLGADRLATGHYARIETDGDEVVVRRAADTSKDQSYFLFDVPREQLRGVLFPLGGLSKQQVRAIARRHGLPVADKPDSYELCFIPDGDKDAFVRRHAAATPAPGAILDAAGRELARHDGVYRFTVGQRRGLGIAASQPLYVLRVDAAAAAVTVGPEELLYADGLLAERCNWLTAAPPTAPFRAAARIRHRHRDAPVRVVPRGDGSVVVRFDEPQRAVAPGQGVALYRDDRLLGGGWISRCLPAARSAAAR